MFQNCSVPVKIYNLKTLGNRKMLSDN